MRDDEVREDGRGANALGHPVSALAHRLRTLRGQPQAPALEAGEWITTGTLTAAFAVAPGERWRTRVQGLPLSGLTVDFVD